MAYKKLARTERFQSAGPNRILARDGDGLISSGKPCFTDTRYDLSFEREADTAMWPEM